MLNVEFLKQNTLAKLSTKSLRLIPLLEMMTDIDGRILSTVEDIRQENVMTPRLIPDALKECETFGFITKNSDGSYNNNYHYLSTGNERTFKYVNVFDFFNDKNFKSQYKRSLNFFYYILTSKLPGKYHTVAAELLYKNSINEKELVVNYFQDFKDMVHHLSTLVATGYLELKFDSYAFSNAAGESKEHYYEVVQNALYSYCGKDSTGQRKRRIKNKKDRHLLKIRVTESLISAEKKSVYDRRTTLKDLESISLSYGYDLNDFNIDQLKGIHNLKREMHDKFGRVGVDIYRKCLLEYFENNHHKFEKDVLSGKFTDILKKVYIMPVIKLNIHTYFTNAPADLSSEEFGSTAVEQTKGFVSFLMNHAFNDDLVLVHYEAVRENEDLYDYLSTNSKVWYKFNQKVLDIYAYEKKLGNSRIDVLNIAMEKQLTNKKRQEEDYKKIGEQKKDKPSKVPFYNWLEQ